MRVLWSLVIMIAMPCMALAQDLSLGQPSNGAVLVIDTNRLFAESRYAQRLWADLEVTALELKTENERIVASLEEEERSLTERRPTMTPEAFRAEADAFDQRAQEIRSARDAKEVELEQARVNVRLRFTEEIRPIVGQIMVERGASAVLDSRTIFVTVRSSDITDVAIARIDEVLSGTSTTTPE